LIEGINKERIMKKIIFYILLTLVLVGLCSKKEKSVYESENKKFNNYLAVKVLEKYINKFKNKIGNQCEPELKEMAGKEACESIQKAMQTLDYKINDVNENGDKTVINITMKIPDFKTVFSKLNNEMDAFLEKEEIEGNDVNGYKKRISTKVKNILVNELSKENLKYREKNLNVVCRKIGSNWILSEEENEEFFNAMVPF
jgi:hypothetical protein